MAVADMPRAGVKPQRLLRTLLPAVSLCLVLGAIAILNPRAISYLGFGLMLNLAIPIVQVTVAQMFVICGNDLDLSIGPCVSFVACISATLLNDAPLLGVGVLLAAIAAYAGLGALIYLRRLPSIIVTSGHELHLAGAGNSCSASAWRHGAGLADANGGNQAGICAFAGPGCTRLSRQSPG